MDCFSWQTLSGPNCDNLPFFCCPFTFRDNILSVFSISECSARIQLYLGAVLLPSGAQLTGFCTSISCPPLDSAQSAAITDHLLHHQHRSGYQPLWDSTYSNFDLLHTLPDIYSPSPDPAWGCASLQLPRSAHILRQRSQLGFLNASCPSSPWRRRRCPASPWISRATGTGSLNLSGFQRPRAPQ